MVESLTELANWNANGFGMETLSRINPTHDLIRSHEGSGYAGLCYSRLAITPYFVYFSCMPTKTITLEIDAYEKLRAAKRGGESFTEVVRRATIPASAPIGKFLREHYRSGGGNVGEEYLDSVEQSVSHDPIPEDPWA